MTTWRWQRRERKRQAKRNRMPKDGMSVFEIQRIKQERDDALRRRRLQRERDAELGT